MRFNFLCSRFGSKFFRMGVKICCKMNPRITHSHISCAYHMHRCDFIKQDLLDKINDQYFKHWLQRDPLTKDEVIMELYQEIALQ